MHTCRCNLPSHCTTHNTLTTPAYLHHCTHIQQTTVPPHQPSPTMSVQLGHLANNIDERSSTRLHAPPGGKQSFNIFGADTTNTQPPRTTGRAAVPQPTPVKPVQAEPAPQTRVAADAVTGQRQSTRVHAAPGGNSTFNIFGGDDSVKQAPKAAAQPAQVQQPAAQSAKPAERSTRPW